MTTIPEPQVTIGTIAEWFNKKKELATLKTTEMLLRKRIFNHFFKQPKEGANNVPMPDGSAYKLCGTHVVNRKVDEPVMRTMWDDLCKQGIPMNDLIKMKPELSVSAYRELTAEQQKLFDQVLIVSDGSPDLEIKAPPKPRIKAGEKAA